MRSQSREGTRAGVGPVVEVAGPPARSAACRASPEPGWSSADQLIWTISLAVVFVLGFAGGARVASRSHEPAAATACVTPMPSPAPGPSQAAASSSVPAGSVATARP